MALVVGTQTRLFGNITTLDTIGAKSPSDLERYLGFQPGRLKEGYAIALLAEPLSITDFEFDGTTLRSGGRLGLPAKTTARDEARVRVHDQILAERGKAGYQQLQLAALKNVSTRGSSRLAKVVPLTGHDNDKAPDIQYPVGVGADLQWKLLKPGKTFLIAAFVDSSAHAHTTASAYFIGVGAPYDNRHKLMRFLSDVKP
jgi:hypothetical protein